ncbi:MAG TPA: nitrate/sulfonate/bicarbonate ABC transporter ATP-binding protein [Candidatus Acidoferrales bacterium]|nr:nitrate/sulfonate/bicarbonate ABC transporter ATP-binding protein [Candidatus Acidoferrales bacterium]
MSQTTNTQLTAEHPRGDDNEPILEGRALEKFYLQPDGGRIQIISPTDIKVMPGQILALLGPSGCGKSTLLRMLTGLSAPSAGEVFYHGRKLTDDPPNVGIVFQSFALFPWLTVLQNVEAPLEARGVAASERHARATRIIDSVGLDGFENAYPKELSGGMKQRVGFARALVIEPEVLFMDEPFSALDVLTAETLRGELMELWNDRKIPTRAIFIVTHNIEEAVGLADRVVVLASHPARIREDFEITLPQPRSRKSEPFESLVDHIYRVLTQPELEHAKPAEMKSALAAPAIAAPAPRYVRLPHVRAGGIAGLLEILVDHGGREDLHRVSHQLMLESDDLLPIVEACVLLGFARVEQGDAEITELGRELAAGDIQRRKEIFREALLAHVPILQQIDSALQTKKDGTMLLDFFHDLLDEHFTDGEVHKQLDTAIQWGRYAELFDYDSVTGRLSRTKP